jgi:hypothetical protein
VPQYTTCFVTVTGRRSGPAQMWSSDAPLPVKAGARVALNDFEGVGASGSGPTPQFPGSISATIEVKYAACRCVSVRSITVEKHELSKVEFEIIDKALKALQQSNLCQPNHSIKFAASLNAIALSPPR